MSKMIILENGTEHILRDGDFFRWRYKEVPTGYGDHYWCKSQKCRWRSDNEKLADLFWSMGSGPDSHTVDPDKVVLSFMGNINYYEEVSKHSLKYYDKEDILDISHKNHSDGWGGCYFLKKGATKSKKVVFDLIANKMDEVEYKIFHEKKELARLQEITGRLASGDMSVDEVWL